MISLQNKQGQQDESHLCLHLSSGHHVYIYIFIYIYVYHTLFSHNNPSNKAFSHDNYWWKCSLMNMWRISWQFFINITMQTLWSPNNICRFSQHFHTHHYPRSRKKQKCEKWFLFTQLCAWCSRFESYDGIHAKQKYHHLLHDTKICVQQCTWWYDWTSGHAAASE